MGSATSRQEVSAEGIEFIRYCYGRRKAGWPELYDEMCAVAARGLFRGWSHEDLATHGIGFSLAGLPALAAVVRRTIEAEPLPRAAARRVGVPIVPDEAPVAGVADEPVAALGEGLVAGVADEPVVVAGAIVAPEVALGA